MCHIESNVDLGSKYKLLAFVEGKGKVELLCERMWVSPNVSCWICVRWSIECVSVCLCLNVSSELARLSLTRLKEDLIQFARPATTLYNCVYESVPGTHLHTLGKQINLLASSCIINNELLRLSLLHWISSEMYKNEEESNLRFLRLIWNCN